MHSEHPLDPAALGITPAAVTAHSADIAADVERSGAPGPKLDVTRLAHVIETGVSLFSENSGESKVLVDVYVDDGKRLAVTSGSTFVLPWHVTVDNRSWTTFDPAITRTLLPVLGTRSPNRRRLLDDDSWWRTDVWKLPWDLFFLATEASDRGLSHARKLPGFDSASKDWFVSGVEETDGKLIVTLERRTPGVFGTVTWAVDDTCSSFDEALRRSARVEQRMSASAWFVRWLGHERLVGHIYVGHGSLYDDRWHDAGMRGHPDVTVDLSASGQAEADVLAGSEDGRLVVGGAPRAKGIDPAFEGMTAETYVVADPSGKLRKRTLAAHTATPP